MIHRLLSGRFFFSFFDNWGKFRSGGGRGLEYRGGLGGGKVHWYMWFVVGEGVGAVLGTRVIALAFYFYFYFLFFFTYGARGGFLVRRFGISNCLTMYVCTYMYRVHTRPFGIIMKVESSLMDKGGLKYDWLIRIFCCVPALLSAQLVTVGEITHSFLYIFTYDDVCTSYCTYSYMWKYIHASIPICTLFYSKTRKISQKPQ